MDVEKITKRIIYTLIFLKRDKEILLGLKTRGHGINTWIGFGGKLENGETLMECAKRELKEESNLEADLKHVGVLYHNLKEKDCLKIVHLFTGTNISNEVKESDEMKSIRWIPYEGIPYDKMLPDFKEWLKFILQDEVYFSVKLLTESTCDTNIYESNEEFFNFLTQTNLN